MPREESRHDEFLDDGPRASVRASGDDRSRSLRGQHGAVYTRAGDHSIRESSRFREAKTIAAGEHDSNAFGERQTMTDADVHRPNAVTRPHNRPDAFTLMSQRRRGTAARADRSRYADQDALRASEARSVEQESDVTRESEAAWMREAVSVKEKHIGFTAQFPNRIEDDRRFTEREQSRNVRKGDPASRDDFFNDGSLSHVPNDDGRDGFGAIS